MSSIFRRAGWDFAARVKRRLHRLIKRRAPAIDAAHPLDLLPIDLLDRQVEDEPRQVILVDELLNRRRRQQRFIDLPGAIALAHQQTESEAPHAASKISNFPDGLLGSNLSAEAPYCGDGNG